MQTVNEFWNEYVKVAMRRGNSMDDALPSAMRAAIRFIERNYNLHYMKRVNTYGLVAGAGTLLLEGMEGTSIKAIKQVRTKRADGWYEFKKLEEYEQPVGYADMPTAFWLTAEQQLQGFVTWRLVFDRPFTEAMDLQITSYNFTEWSGDLMDRGIWLVNNAPGLLCARMMLTLAPIMRDPQLMSMWQVNYREELSALINNEDEILRGAA